MKIVFSIYSTLLIFSSIFKISVENVFNWNNILIDIKKETPDFVLGILGYRITEKEIHFFDYLHLNTTVLNLICSKLEYDNFQSFSMKYFTRSLRKKIIFLDADQLFKR